MPMKLAQTVMRSTSGHDHELSATRKPPIDGHGFQRIISSETLHGANFRGKRRNGAADYIRR